MVRRCFLVVPVFVILDLQVCVCVCVCVCVFINSLSLSRRKESLKTVLENENKENEKCYFTMLVCV